SKNQFRLMYLKPLSNDPTVIHCTVRAVPLDSAPPYEALSYVWGSQTRSRPINVNGVEIRSKKSLYTALHDLAPDEGVRILWADAICIDQTNDEEKVHQVGLMRQIYRNATAVLAFLGDPYEGVDIAIEYLSAA
ncbi:heterokaryon incompatibility protein-domain-containing protein, partial [Apiosordaria backusii]